MQSACNVAVRGLAKGLVCAGAGRRRGGAWVSGGQGETEAATATGLLAWAASRPPGVAAAKRHRPDCDNLVVLVYN